MTESASTTSDVYGELLQLVEPHGQRHLLQFWDRLSAEQKQHLASQIRTIDFKSLARLASGGETSEDWAGLARRAELPQAFRLSDQVGRSSSVSARATGEKALRNGKVGVILVAGGQGTRLGFDHPKGMYRIGPVSNEPLFQILFEKIDAVGKRSGAKVPLYVMTSDATHAETERYLKEQSFFGLSPDNVRFFCQGTMPAVDAANGRVLLAGKDQIALSPDGHGGMLAALERTGALGDIERRGLAQLFYFQVDNPLVQICDPLFLGYHIQSQSEMSSIAISKRDPLERVGNVVRIDGRTQVIEYSDFPDDVARQKNADGSLRFWAGSIAIHVFDTAFLRSAAGNEKSLPFHVARKKVAHFDEQGNRTEPSVPNAVKFERFIFDLLPLAKNSIVVEADPSVVFAPVKNPPGDKVDSPDTCRAAMIALHRKWLEAAGARIGPTVPVEISPLYALDAEELRTKIKPGLQVDKPTYFR